MTFVLSMGMQSIIYIYIYIYIYISGHKWSATHRVLKSDRSKMSVIYMCYHESNENYELQQSIMGETLVKTI